MDKSSETASPPPDEVQPGGLIAPPYARSRAGRLAAGRPLRRSIDALGTCGTGKA